MKILPIYKFIALIKLVIGFLFALPILILRPLKIIRFSYIESLVFGSLIYGPNTYFNENYLVNLNKKKTFDVIFFNNKKFCNEALKKIWLRKKKIYSYNFILFCIFRFFQFFKFNSHFFVIPSYPAPINKFFVNLENKNKDRWGWPFTDHFKFSEQEHKEGLEILKKFKINHNDKWICIHNRDSSYLNQKIGENKREMAHTHRNFKVKTLLEAAEQFANSGYFVFRMGSSAKEKLISENKKIIDYAFSQNKSEFADLYLLANCSAYFGSDSGIRALPILKRKPACSINFSPLLLHFLTYYNLLPVIFKKIKSIKTGQILSFKEIFENKLHNIANDKLILEKGYEFVSNTNTEIKNLSIEVCQHLEGKHFYTTEEKIYQNKFQNLITKYIDKKILGNCRPNIGKYFINQNLNLLN